MPDQVQLRGGTSNENDGFTGAEREVTVDTTSHTLRVHDGTTPGGHSLVSGVSSTSSDPGTLIQRDDWGRAQVSEPVNDGDIANKGWVEEFVENSIEGALMTLWTPWKDGQEYSPQEPVQLGGSASLALVRERTADFDGGITVHCILFSSEGSNAVRSSFIKVTIDGQVVTPEDGTQTNWIRGNAGWTSAFSLGPFRVQDSYLVEGRVNATSGSSCTAWVLEQKSAEES